MPALAAAALMAPMAIASVTPAAPPAQAATAYPPGGPDQTPVMGWSGWSFLREAENEAAVEGEARALVSTGLSSVGYRYVNIDDGWYQCPGPQGPNVDKYGRWVVNAANYPSVGSDNGIKALAAYVHRLGLKFGIYETTGISGQAVKKNTPILGTRYTADEIATKTPANNYNCGGMGRRLHQARRHHQQQRPRHQGLAGRDSSLPPPDGARQHPGQLHDQARADTEEVLQPVGIRP
jgi:alpha-galactosidase